MCARSGQHHCPECVNFCELRHTCAGRHAALPARPGPIPMRAKVAACSASRTDRISRASFCSRAYATSRPDACSIAPALPPSQDPSPPALPQASSTLQPDGLLRAWTPASLGPQTEPSAVPSPSW
eukprot:366323-Chlamydomonas_euryale.AAC.10